MASIEKRYQYWGANGVTWTKWYTHKLYKTREEAEQDFPRVSSYKEPNKLLNEYRIV